MPRPSGPGGKPCLMKTRMCSILFLAGLASVPGSAAALLAVLLCLAALPAGAQFRISEFMASNSRTLADEDGSFEDWIEIQNTSPTNASLEGWSLTDSAGNPT